MVSVAPRFHTKPITGDMDDLTPMQRSFVDLFLESDGSRKAATEAARAAGCGPTTEKARAAAREMLRNPRVCAVLNSEVRKRFDSEVVTALKTLADLSSSAKSEQVRLSAAQAILDRSSIGPIMSRNANVNVNTGPQMIMEALQQVWERRKAEAEAERLAAATNAPE